MPETTSTNVVYPTPVQALPPQVFPNSELLYYGGSATAIIIAISFLLRAVGDMIRVLVPVMLERREYQQIHPAEPKASLTDDTSIN